MREVEPGPASMGQPFLRWVGGKRQLLPAILPHVPQGIRQYYEPFLGGGALYFALASIRARAGERWDGAYLSDINEELMRAYAAVRDDPDGVLRALAALPTDEATFRGVRSDPTGRAFERHVQEEHLRGVRMVFLNRLGFNGLYRVNAKGGDNTPYGKRPFGFASEWFRNAIHDASRRLMGAQLAAYDVTDFDRRLTYGGPARLPSRALIRGLIAPGTSRGWSGVFVYCDPPYVPISATANFTSYSAGKFGWDKQVALREEAEAWARAGARVLLSNSGADAVRELYKGERILTVQASRQVAARTSSRAKVDEVLIKIGDAAWRNA